MDCYVSVMTGKGTGAISTIQIFGSSAEAVLKKIFKPTGIGPAKFDTGQILLGTIVDEDNDIDQVTIGCEGPETFAINCHGNPLIVEMIMQLLKRRGAELLTAEQMLIKIFTAQSKLNTIEIEARPAQIKAKTLQGAKIITNQAKCGLNKTAQNWQNELGETTLEKIQSEAKEILEKTRTAKLIIHGCTAALTGPPNTGKSTLLNYLAGRQKSIVTDIKGTTRDWVEAECQIESLSLTLIDTAGLNEEPDDDIGKAAQQKSIQILEQADLILLVLDNNQPNDQLDKHLIDKIADKTVITVLNKNDLPAKFNPDELPESLSNRVQISAKLGTGIEGLKNKILQILNVADFDSHQPVCITGRQQDLLQQLSDAKSKEKASSIIAELLNGRPCA